MTPLLRAEAVHKRFGATRALAGVDLEVRAGEVHALLGENGAGKSTLMNLLYGALPLDEGRLELAGSPYAPRTPLEARERGVAMVHQEPLLCPELTVHENLLLGVEPTRFGVLSRSQATRTVERALSAIGAGERADGRGGGPGSARERRSALDPRRPASSLSSSERQLVAVARALASTECRLLILDEPTSSLTEDDVGRLFAVIDGLRASGLAIIYISHFLEEVRRIADRFTVLRDGKSVGAGSVGETSDAELVRMMVGREVSELFVRSERQPGEAVLRAEHLCGRERSLGVRLLDATLELRRGEVLGVFGLVGSGRSELLRAIFGLDPVQRGELRVKTFSGRPSPAALWAEGAGFLSEDRKGEGLATNLSIADNLTLTRLSALGRAGFVSPSRLRTAAARFVRNLSIKCRSEEQVVAELSGGNQQKVAVARLLYHEADVLLLDEPTRGVDVQSRAEIYGIIDRLAAAGMAVLLVSSYIPELLGVCDGVQVMRRGRLGPRQEARSLTPERLLEEAIG